MVLKTGGLYLTRGSTLLNLHDLPCSSNSAFGMGAGVACRLERQTHDQKVASLNPGRSGGRIFFSRFSFVCWLLFGVHSNPILPQWHINPSHSAESAGGRLHLNMHTSLTQRSRSVLTMPLSRNSVGAFKETSSHLREHLVTVFSARWATLA